MLEEQLLNRVDLLLGRQSREINAVDLCAKRTCESDNTAIMDRIENSVHTTSFMELICSCVTCRDTILKFALNRYNKVSSLTQADNLPGASYRRRKSPATAGVG
jgi:hypothetical protein